AQIDSAIFDCNTAAAAVVADRQAAKQEYDNAPTDDNLLRLHADHNSAEQQRRDAQNRLGEADAKLAEAEHALGRARDDLSIDSRDLTLPAQAWELDRLDKTLGEYKVALSELANAIRRHQGSLIELTQQIMREEQADEAAQAARQDNAERQSVLREARETADT